MKLFIILFLAIFTLHALPHTESAKILAVFPFPGPSQYILVQPYLKTLAASGHEVTVISAFPQKEKITNFRDIPALEIHEYYAKILAEFVLERGIWEDLNFFSEFVNLVTVTALRNEQVKKLLRSKEEKFDLVIVETVMTDALYGFAQHFNAPIIGVSSYGTDSNIDELVGNISPVSYIPQASSGLSGRMNFWQRLVNLTLKSIETLYMHLVHLPKQVKIYKEYFPNATADLLDIRKNFSLMLLNQHFSLTSPRPYVPNMIQIAGFHINHIPAPLPKDIQTFLNSSTEDVIYFSMGSNLKSKNLPKEKLLVLMETFASLKQNVMWKFENADLPGKPDNVFISQWFPQPDILAHPKVKLFITHGGLLSTMEAIYHGKPVVGMPIFFDQFLNVERAKKAGIGLGVDLSTLNVVELKAAIMEILNNRKYTDLVTKMSQLYRDQPMKPLDTAIFWTEYVLRHNGAPHMRVASQEMSFIEKNTLDTAGVLYGGLIFVIFIVIYVHYKLITLILCRKPAKLTQEKKKKQA